MEDVYLSEMLPSELEWNKTFLADDIMCVYVDEMKNFMECIYLIEV